MAIARLPRTLVNQILQQALRTPDREVCGLIGSRNAIPTRCYPVPNVSPEPQRLFEMDPQGQIEAMRQMRERGETLFGIYHSHPCAPPLPSARDVAENQYPDALYLIVSLNTKGVLELQGFRIRDGQVMPVELEVTESTEEAAGSAFTHAG
ncbi:MAG: M67 family metallopeptidase [Gammaproteobacteria bacterium]